MLVLCGHDVLPPGGPVQVTVLLPDGQLLLQLAVVVVEDVRDDGPAEHSQFGTLQDGWLLLLLAVDGVLAGLVRHGLGCFHLIGLPALDGGVLPTPIY